MNWKAGAFFTVSSGMFRFVRGHPYASLDAKELAEVSSSQLGGIDNACANNNVDTQPQVFTVAQTELAFVLQKSHDPYDLTLDLRRTKSPYRMSPLSSSA